MRRFFISFVCQYKSIFDEPRLDTRYRVLLSWLDFQKRYYYVYVLLPMPNGHTCRLLMLGNLNSLESEAERLKNATFALVRKCYMP